MNQSLFSNHYNDILFATRSQLDQEELTRGKSKTDNRKASIKHLRTINLHIESLT